ncbi:hypothetical protein H0H93_016195 [Arthromyces matolae]|nr:hypothetical protein H0H93_016195 [Arthromyces matolae]
MPFNRNICLFFAFVLLVRDVTATGSAVQGMEDALAIQQEQLQRMNDFLGPVANVQNSDPAPTITFNNPAAKQFFVDGTKIPEVDFDAGPSYAGLMPISGNKNETRKLFFWFWPTNNASNAKDLTFWTNGAYASRLEAEKPDSLWETKAARVVRRSKAFCKKMGLFVRTLTVRWPTISLRDLAAWSWGQAKPTP